MKKKIVFVGGTVRSGTTLLNLFLNSERVLVLGELRNLFWPSQKMHHLKIAELKNDPVWSVILERGFSNVFSSLSKAFPKKDVFIDSSKDYNWIFIQKKFNSTNFEIKTVIVYKPLEEFAQSILKRNSNNWGIIYKRVYLSYILLIKDFYLINYNDFVNSFKIREQLMEYLGYNFDYTRDKVILSEIEYNFFGSPSLGAKNNEVNIERREVIIDISLKKKLALQLKYDFILLFLVNSLKKSKSRMVKDDMFSPSIKYLLYPAKLFLLSKIDNHKKNES